MVSSHPDSKSLSHLGLDNMTSLPLLRLSSSDPIPNSYPPTQVHTHICTPPHICTYHTYMHTCTHTHTRQLKEIVLGKALFDPIHPHSHELILASQMPARAQSQRQREELHTPSPAPRQCPAGVSGSPGTLGGAKSVKGWVGKGRLGRSFIA